MSKLTIARSYTRKVNMGNYESEDFFASRSLEIAPDTPQEAQNKISTLLFLECVKEVGENIKALFEMRAENDGKISFEKLEEMKKNILKGVPNLLDDYLKLDNEQQKVIQDAKREWKRNEYAKEKEGK